MKLKFIQTSIDLFKILSAPPYTRSCFSAQASQVLYKNRE